eukprot:SM000093S24452  [mRNA]  locus=s93:389190:390775:- [translate_table: standard]
MALLDAFARSQGVPLWRLFGGHSHSLTTDITIPICEPGMAAQLAAAYKKEGFTTIKVKTGGKTKAGDLGRLKAIRCAFPECAVIVDGNCGYTAAEALTFLEELQGAGLLPVLFEQPTARDDWAGLTHVSRVASKVFDVLVAADESCRGGQDARRLADGQMAGVLNIKLAKSGVLGALEIIEIAKKARLGLMIGGMIETRLAMGFAAHLAAGTGGFRQKSKTLSGCHATVLSVWFVVHRFIDLDTPLLLASDPVHGGYTTNGPHYELGHSPGLGAWLSW